MPDRLTKKQLVICGLMLHGLRDKQIADLLGLSFCQVRNQVKGIFQKTGAQTRAQLMGKVYQLQGLSPEFSSAKVRKLAATRR